MKESIILYLSHYEVIKDLPNETLGKLYRTIFEYELGNKIKIDEDIKVAFGFIYNQVKLDKQKYEDKCKKNRENGLKGGRPKKPNGYFENPKKPNGLFQNPNDNENDNDNENVNVNDNNKLLLYVEFNWQRTLTSTEITKLQEFEDMYGFDEVKKAVDISCEHNALSIAYVKGILLKKPNKPKWLGKKVEKQKLTNEEKEEMERMLKDFK